MKRPRTTLRTLLIVVGVVGFSLGSLYSLRSPSFATLKVVESVLLLSLLFAVVAARFATGKAGAFWFGFAVWGGTVYIYIHNTWQIAHVIHDLMNPLAIYFHFVPTKDPFAALNQAEAFEIINCVYNDMFALWLGCLGGLAAMAMAIKCGTLPRRADRP